ncbi:serine hydrolase [Pedobacter sp. AJM]|uniref:serine hydrolase domain-containing protein n=1 Tax=Pedobacter sp. AJM TaxID=2003629 RepID=UPI000B4B5F8C|nr:serine hydrolase domain-containing protein [Pedobacter sp. AJM]OWK71489.1 hypothetical protein CBW18_10595 [Pedobacter sp. AJM]
MKYLLLFAYILIINYNVHAQSKNLKKFIADYASQHQFNGTILIKKDAKIIYHQSFGLAERSFNSPIKNNTKYQICSITKTFTAVLILQLMEQGKIDLNKKINSYFPSYKGEGGSKVSIHQLLNHTSGMKNTDTATDAHFMRYGIGFYHNPYTLEEIVDNFCSNPLINEPGKTFDYNNGEYMILGRILEIIYKKPYEKILEEQILIPLHMSNSGIINHYKLIPNLATAYYEGKNIKLIPNIPLYIEDFSAAGAMYSCTTDLIKFNDALFSHQLINKQTLNQLLTPGLDDYGYGVWIRDYKGVIDKYKRMERYGRIQGANCAWFHYLNRNVSIIMLSNTNLTDLGDFAFRIGKAIF